MKMNLEARTISNSMSGNNSLQSRTIALLMSSYQPTK